MQFKLAVTAAVLSALAVFAAPAPCASSDPSTTDTWWPQPTSSDPWSPAPSSTNSWWPQSSSTDTWWPQSSSTDTWWPQSSSTDPWAQKPKPTTTSTSDAGSCNAGANLCCNSVESADNLSSGTTSLLGAIGVNVDDLLNDVGLGCSSLVGGASCQSNTVCCQNDSFSGLVALGCVPINIAL